MPQSVHQDVMPQWKPKEPIYADRIVDIKVKPSEEVWTLACGHMIYASASMYSSASMLRLGSPRVGDYYVKDAAGMHGWQAASTFLQQHEPWED